MPFGFNVFVEGIGTLTALDPSDTAGIKLLGCIRQQSQTRESQLDNNKTIFKLQTETGRTTLAGPVSPPPIVQPLRTCL